MVDALVVAQTIQRAVDALADVADGLLGWTHVHVLDVALETRQRGQVLVAWIAAKIVTTTGAATARGVQVTAGGIQCIGARYASCAA